MKRVNGWWVLVLWFVVMMFMGTERDAQIEEQFHGCDYDFIMEDSLDYVE